MAHDGIASATPAPLPDCTSGQRWARLPTKQLPDGGRTGRLAVRFDGRDSGFLALVIAARFDRLVLNFQVVEPRPMLDSEHDPRSAKS
jgi:hypothetical protein